MSIDTLNIVSEAPTARAQEIARLVETLGLAEGRLSEAELARVVQAVGERHDLFDDLVVSDEQNRWWLLLYGAANFELKLLTWERGQVSNWHDHGGSSGAFEVARGDEVVDGVARDGEKLGDFADSDEGWNGILSEYVHICCHGI